MPSIFGGSPVVGKHLDMARVLPEHPYLTFFACLIWAKHRDR